MARKKARDNKRQTKINFSPASQTSRATRSSATPMAGASQKPQKPTKGSASRASKKTCQDSTSEDELAQETERGLRIGMFNDRNNHANGSSSSEEEQPVEKQPKSKSKKRRREATSSESEGEATVVVIPRKRQRYGIKVEIESSEEDRKRKKKKKQAKSEPAPRSARRGVARKASTPNEEEEEEEEEQNEHTPPRSVRRKLKRRRPASDDDEDEDEDETHGANKDSASDMEESDCADDTGDNEEQEELKEDLAFLRSSPVADSRRSTSTTLKNKRQEALEALKRRRAGTTEASSSATPVRRKTVVIDSDSDSDSELEIIKEEEEDSDVEASDQDDSEDEQETNAFDMFQEDQDDEQFIDDTENIIGEPAANDDLDELRLTLSLSRAKTKDLFRHAVEWMVMKKIHPGFESTKNIYTVTFRKLDDEVKGLAGSKYTSAAWTSDFTRAIRARPDLMINDLSASERAAMSPHCEACNRTNHTASSELLFQGAPYNPDTLEPLSSNSDSDSDSDSDSSTSSALSSDSETLPNGGKPTYNYQKERIPPESHRFPVGSTCKANAQVAHTLYHWRYHLYQWVKDYLKAEGHFTEKKLVKREGWSDRKRAKAAAKIVKRMEDKGQIRELYHSYKNQITAAVEADNRFENRWGRRGR
ncbi:hypothetical protein COCCADRAFT_27900 [Bipolaris zeicola 26-R-13]|uniref:DUF4211 domain-containing protein n=1 Tax=Cochliobolus carbonum (strain 26-R-13) TaxID=930089 RepID=W6XVB9_COCC2|nr:uncharacterized protein COCCADRAFT_27900 [Bipolaris zeicola 26-R-13]EUC31382.1 hypothetical protein COCCADRAFT_27900 [Bipolaris zeicola 26-R-13]